MAECRLKIAVLKGIEKGGLFDARSIFVYLSCIYIYILTPCVLSLISHDTGWRGILITIYYQIE